MKKILLFLCLFMLCGCAKTNQITLEDLKSEAIQYKEVDQIPIRDVSFSKKWKTYEISKDKKKAYYAYEAEGSKILCAEDTYTTFLAPFVDEGTLRRINAELSYQEPREEAVTEIGFKQYLIRIYHHEKDTTIEFLNKVMERRAL